MTIKDVLAEAKIPRNEAEILLAHLVEKERSWLLAHHTEEIDATILNQFQKLVARRLAHEPIAYITGTKEFYGRTFMVTPDVLIPRPATEHLINAIDSFLEHTEKNIIDADTQVIIATKRLQNADPTTIVDIGTGSGCIAITAALAHPSKKIIATDISVNALEVARQNAEAHQVEIDFRVGNLLEPISDVSEPFLLVSNPPYIPKTEKLMPDVEDYEPHQALFSGDDGADLLRLLVVQAALHPKCVGILVECRTEHAILLT